MAINPRGLLVVLIFAGGLALVSALRTEPASRPHRSVSAMSADIARAGIAVQAQQNSRAVARTPYGVSLVGPSVRPTVRPAPSDGEWWRAKNIDALRTDWTDTKEHCCKQAPEPSW